MLGRYLVGAGALRFAIEFIRVDKRVALGLSVAHFVSLTAVAAGVGLLAFSDHSRRAAYSEHKLS